VLRTGGRSEVARHRAGHPSASPSSTPMRVARTRSTQGNPWQKDQVSLGDQGRSRGNGSASTTRRHPVRSRRWSRRNSDRRMIREGRRSRNRKRKRLLLLALFASIAAPWWLSGGGPGRDTKAVDPLQRHHPGSPAGTSLRRSWQTGGVKPQVGSARWGGARVSGKVEKAAGNIGGLGTGGQCDR